MKSEDTGWRRNTKTGGWFNINDIEDSSKAPTNKYMNDKIRGSVSFNNRKNLTTHIKEQTNVDLDKMATEKQFAPRRGLNIDSRKASENDFNTLKSYLLKNNIRIESNGVYDYFITYKK